MILCDQEYSRRFSLVAANDLADAETLKYLLKYDSFFGRFAIESERLNAARFSQAKTPEDCDFRGADIVLDCTGKFARSADLNCYLENGARRAVISTPPLDSAIVMPPPPEKAAKTPLVSAGSCTANALYLLGKVMRENFGAEAVLATSIHSYTSDQKLLEEIPINPDDISANGICPAKSVLYSEAVELRRVRASAINIIPVETSAAKNLARYDRRFAARSAAIGLRVPTPNVSLMQATFLLPKPAIVSEINVAFSQAADEKILKIAPSDLVLRDFAGDRALVIADLSLTIASGNIAQICAWHDNETAFAARMLDLAAI
jgi:glyceraldehyde 3-phosphate dehydrogenase